MPQAMPQFLGWAGRLFPCLDGMMAGGMPAPTTPSAFPSKTRLSIERLKMGIELLYIQPRKPQQSAYIEHYNRAGRTE